MALLRSASFSRFSGPLGAGLHQEGRRLTPLAEVRRARVRLEGWCGWRGCLEQDPALGVGAQSSCAAWLEQRRPTKVPGQ